MNFDKWARDLADQLREKEQAEEKPKTGVSEIVSVDIDLSSAYKDHGENNKDKLSTQAVGIKPEDLYTHKDIMRGEYTKLQEEARVLHGESDKAPLFVLGHNCTSTGTVGSISSIPDIDYNGVSPKKGKRSE